METLDLDILEEDTEETKNTRQVYISNFEKYYQQIQKIPLLTAKEEIELGQQIYPVFEKHYEQFKGQKPIAQLTLKAIQDNNPETYKLIQKLVYRNLRLVIREARRYSHLDMDFEELVQEGNISLHWAAARFNPAKGTKFSTSAISWIKQGMSRFISDKRKTIRLPVHRIESLQTMKKVYKKLQALLKRDPSKEELSKALNLPPEEIESLISDLYLFNKGTGCVSTDVLVSDESGESKKKIIDFIPDNQKKEKLELNEIYKLFDKAKLSRKEKTVLCYLFLVPEPLTVIQLTKQINEKKIPFKNPLGRYDSSKVRRQTVDFIRKRALQKLQKTFTQDELRDILS